MISMAKCEKVGGEEESEGRIGGKRIQAGAYRV